MNIKFFLVLVVVAVLGVFIFSRRPSPPISGPTPSLDSELSTPVPTSDIKAADPKDQQVIDELNQYQDKSFDQDFTEIQTQF